MSDVYIQRLRAIQEDLVIAREVFQYVTTNWHRQEVADDFRLRTLRRVQAVEANLETTYFVRLTAEFEGILKDHLQTNHPAVPFPAVRRNWTLDWFLSRVIQRERLTVSVDLRQRLDEVRDYRNALAHGNAAALVITFTQALARYNTFLAVLPDPHR